MGNNLNRFAPKDNEPPKPTTINVDIEDLDVKKKELPVSLLNPQAPAAPGQQAQAPPPRRFEEILPSADPLGVEAFRRAGLIGTEEQQLNLLSYFAMLSEDFKRYREHTTRAPTVTNERHPQFLLLSGAPGTGKTAHAKAFSRALGLPLVHVDPSAGERWVHHLSQDVKRDCILFFDELDQFTSSSEQFASQLRQFLDGMTAPLESRIIVVGTTNAPERIPADIRHRAENLQFKLPLARDLTQMWGLYARHLPDDQIAQLGEEARAGGLTGRDVKHCAGYAERRSAVAFLNQSGHGGGYGHGSVFAACPGPVMSLYQQCIQQRVESSS